MNPAFNEFHKKMTKPSAFRLFMLTQLPSAFFAGLRIESFNESKSVISIKQKWFNKNPFRSIYFAILSMAAELSTGLAGFSAIYKRNPAVSMLVTESEGKFYKKATGKICFTFRDVADVNAIVEEAIISGKGVTIKCRTIGTNQANEIVAEFSFTWSFKQKAK